MKLNAKGMHCKRHLDVMRSVRLVDCKLSGSKTARRNFTVRLILVGWLTKVHAPRASCQLRRIEAD